MAVNSANPVIAGATKLLIKENYPTNLLLFNRYYLQCIDFTDAFPGLHWKIVVLMPATTDVDHLDSDSPLYFGSLALSSLSTFSSTAALILTLFFWKHKIVVLSQRWLLLMYYRHFTIIFENLVSHLVQRVVNRTHFGSIVLAVMSFFLVGENTPVSCAIRPYLFFIGFTFSFAPFLFKSVKAMLVLLGNDYSRKTFDDRVFVFTTIVLIAIDFLFLTTTLYIGNVGGTNSETKYVLMSNGVRASMTYCAYYNNTSLSAALIAYKGVMLLGACYTSFKTRNFPDILGGSKIVLVVVYCTTFLAAVVILLIAYSQDVRTVVFTEVIGISFYVLITSFLVTGPWLYVIIFIGDTESVINAVVDELKEVRRQNAIKIPTVDIEPQELSCLPSGINEDNINPS